MHRIDQGGDQLVQESVRLRGRGCHDAERDLMLAADGKHHCPVGPEGRIAENGILEGWRPGEEGADCLDLGEAFGRNGVAWAGHSGEGSLSRWFATS